MKDSAPSDAATLQTSAAAPTLPRQSSARWLPALTALALLLTVAALALAWTTQQRVMTLERELVGRQADSQAQATEARVLARAAQDVAREAAAQTALLDARVSENAMHRSQIEELLQSVSRSRDENVVADIEAAVRVALQQSALTGSAEPLVATLKQADERLARYNQPRLERVRRAVNRDLDRVRALGAADIASLSARLDEAARLVDELPLLAVAEPRSKVAVAPRAASAPTATTSADAADADWRAHVTQWWRLAGAQVAAELRALVRVTQIDHPEAMLVTPEQQYFLRENLKLRLLNARLALLSRQLDVAQGDLQSAQAVIDRYFDRSSRQTQLAAELIKQVAAQTKQVGLPRPDNTLAALAAAAAVR